MSRAATPRKRASNHGASGRKSRWHSESGGRGFTTNRSAANARTTTRGFANIGVRSSTTGCTRRYGEPRPARKSVSNLRMPVGRDISPDACPVLQVLPVLRGRASKGGREEPRQNPNRHHKHHRDVAVTSRRIHVCILVACGLLVAITLSLVPQRQVADYVVDIYPCGNERPPDRILLFCDCLFATAVKTRGHGWLVCSDATWMEGDAAMRGRFRQPIATPVTVV